MDFARFRLDIPGVAAVGVVLAVLAHAGPAAAGPTTSASASAERAPVAPVADPQTSQPTRPPDARVSTRQQLIDALAAGKKFIWVENTARIDLGVGDDRDGAPDSVLYIPDGVTLASGRSPTVPGGLLYMSTRLQTQSVMLDLGRNTRITGLRLRGYAQFDNTSRKDPTQAIRVRRFPTEGAPVDTADSVLIDNNEIFGWPRAGVNISDVPTRPETAGQIRVTGNFIHNNVQCGFGLGVAIGSKGYVMIDRNVFNFNRHDVAADGLPGVGYVAELNFILTSGPTCDGFYNQHFDMHGTGGTGSEHVGGIAGEYLEIRRNTIRGDQSYAFLGRLTRPAFELRGTPQDRAIFADNAVAHDDEEAAVRIKGVDRGALKRSGKLVVTGNRYGVDTAAELAVGDFNGDRKADVFQSTGALWAYSPSGQGEWRVINDSSVRLNRLALGDFNDDAVTDVFSQSGAQWLVSYSGTGPWTPLPASSNIDMKSYRFGDFDGDRKTDVFRANGARFYYSSGAATAWKPLAVSTFKVDDLRFGDFNGDRKTDVFSLANGQWSVSYGGATKWQRLNARLSSNLGELVLANFNGDGRADVARSRSGRWEVSYGGRGPWQALQTRSQPPFAGMLFADFTGDRRADVLQHGTFTPPTPNQVPRFVSQPRFALSSGGTAPLAPWSPQDMR